MSQPTRTIGIVEDDDRLRRFLERLIDESGDLRTLFSAATVADALAELSVHTPDLCLVDLSLPDGRGVIVIEQVKRQTDCKVLVLSVLGDRATVMQVLQAGADGYLLKSGRAEPILREIRETLDGQTMISPQIAAYLLEIVCSQAADKVDSGPLGEALTDRETEVLNLFARGLSYRETAEALSISPNTISNYVKSIYSKLSVHSRSEAVYEAQTRGLLHAPAQVKPGKKI
jgi:DNA-binding NarL/FixJ family response regulator